MTRQEANQILENADAQIVIDTHAGTVAIDGELTIEELQALLQLLEYSA